MKLKPKLLFILPLPPPVHGASLRNKSLIESRRIREAYNIKIIPIYFAKDNSDIGKFSILKVFKGLKLFKNVFNMVRNFKPNLAYINFSTYGFALYRDTILVMMLKWLRIHTLLHLRTQGIKDQVLKSKFKKLLFTNTFRKISVICLSQRLGEDIKLVYNKPPFIVNNGIDFLDEFEYLKPRLNKSKPVRFFFLSNFDKTKGIFDLIDAGKLLSDKEKKFEIWIAGKDSQISAMDIQNRITKTNLNDEIKLLPPSYGKDKVNLFKQTDIFVFPSFFEAFPGVILEAMQFGLPVISTNEGAIPEIITNGKTGFIIKKRSIRELAEAMNRFIHNPQLIYELGRTAQEEFLAKYTLTHFEKNMVKTFKEVLKNN